MHLSLKSSLGRQILTGTYVKDNRVLDLTTPFSELTFTLDDKSGEGNDATLYSGRYVAYDGVSDKTDFSEITLSEPVTEVRCKARSASQSSVNLGLASGTIVANSTWQDVVVDTPAKLYGGKMWFDGTTAEFIDFSSHVATFQSKTKGKITGSFVLPSSAGVHRIFSASDKTDGSSDLGIIINNGNFQVVVREASLGSPLILWTGSTRYDDNQLHSFEFVVTDSGNSMIVDGVDVTSGGVYTNGSSSTVAWFNNVLLIDFLAIGVNEDSTGKEFPFLGIIHDVAVYDEDGTTKLAEWQGYGNTDDKWVDTVGSNNGTVNGSPSNFLIPASDTTPTNDALGNAIAEPRPTADTWNLFGDGEYGQVADADSLDLTTEATWELWGNFSGATTEQYAFHSFDFTNGKRSWGLIFGTTYGASKVGILRFGSATGAGLYSGSFDIGTGIKHISVTYNAGTLVVYVNGVATTLNTEAGTIPTSLFVTDTGIRIGATFIDTYPLDTKISRPKIYNVAFTADEVLKNYNAQKGAFGL